MTKIHNYIPYLLKSIFPFITSILYGTPLVNKPTYILFHLYQPVPHNIATKIVLFIVLWWYIICLWSLLFSSMNFYIYFWLWLVQWILLTLFIFIPAFLVILIVGLKLNFDIVFIVLLLTYLLNRYCLVYSLCYNFFITVFFLCSFVSWLLLA